DDGHAAVVDGDTMTWEAYEPFDSRAASMLSDRVIEIQAHAGGAWFVLESDGTVVRAIEEPGAVERFGFEAEGEKVREIFEICGDPTRHAFAATDAGLFEIDGGRLTRHEVLGPAAGAAASPITYSCEQTADGDLWVGSVAGLSVRRAGETAFRFLAPDEGSAEHPPSGYVVSLLEDPEGGLWVGSSGHLSRLRADPDSGAARFTTYRWRSGGEAYDGQTPRKLLKDHRGTVWVAAMGGGLFRLDPGDPWVRYSPDHPDEHDPKSAVRVLDLHEDSVGNLWIGTAGGGLRRLSADRQQLSVWSAEEGLSGDSVYAMAQIGDDLWMLTSSGLDRLSVSSGEVGGLANVADGVTLSGLWSLNRSSGDRLWLPATEDLVVFDVPRIDRTLRGAEPPTPRVTGLRLFNRPVVAGPDSPLDRAIHRVDELTLDHRQDVLTFELSSPGFDELESRRYAYRLEPFDQDWLETDASTALATYTNLDHGRYTLRVKTSAGGSSTFGQPRDVLVLH
ncbi:MAG: two-component regulator propeller domain-containing protein, partial [Acidobacteriota bacterium]